MKDSGNEPVPGEQPDSLSQAIIAWTGWGQTPYPRRDEARVAECLGKDVAVALMPFVKRLENEFYASDAAHRGADLKALGDSAAAEFRVAHPELSSDAVDALAWCYIFDWK